jgi:methyl-accepting chemotaxis protein
MKNLKLRLTMIALVLILVSMMLGLLVPRFALDASDQIREEHLAVAAFVFLGLCGVLFHGLVERALSPVMNLSDNFVRMRAGDLNPRLPVEGPEEMQQLAHTFNDMLEDLEIQIRDITEEKYSAERGRQYLQERLEASQRFKTAMDAAPVGILLADTDLNIIYQNEASESGFLQFTDQLTWNTDVVVGRSMTLLYPDEEEARGILSDPDRLPYEANVTIGPYHLQLMAAPITSEEGDYLGPLLLWDTVVDAPETAGEEYALLAEDTDIQEIDDDLGLALLAEELESDEQEATVTLEEVSEPPVQDPGSFRRGATLVGRSVRLISDRISTISSMVEALCNEGDNLRKSLEETRQRTQNSAYLTSERSEVLWDLVNEMNGVGERSKASGTLVKRLKKGLNDADKISSSVTHLADSIDHLVLEARLEIGRAGEAGSGMKVVVDAIQKLSREASRLNKDVETKLDRIRNEVEDMVSLFDEDRREARAGGRLARRAEHALGRIERDLTEVDERTDLLAEMGVGQAEIGSHVASQLENLTELVNVTVRVAREQVRLVRDSGIGSPQDPGMPIQEI